MSIRYIWHVMSFNSHTFSFSADDLSTGDSRVLNFPKITILCIICGSRPNSMCLMEFGVSVFAVYMLKLLICINYLLYIFWLVSVWNLFFRVAITFLFLKLITFLHLYPKVVSIVNSEVYFLEAIERGILFSDPKLYSLSFLEVY